MNVKKLFITLSVLLALGALVVLLVSRPAPVPDHPLRAPVDEKREARPLEERFDGTSRESVTDERAAEIAPGPSANPLGKGDADEPLDNQGALFTGRVEDASGVPVGGAEIWVHSRLRETLLSWPWALRVRLATHSDARGAFSVHADPTDSLEARASGHAPSRVERARPGGDPIVLALRGPAASLVGSVHAMGSTVAGARIDLRRPRGLVSNRERASRNFKASTEGGFALDDLAPGHATLIASAPGFAPGEAQVELHAGETSKVSLELEVAATLEGIVLARDQTPLAKVRILAPAHVPPAIEQSDEFGTFAMTGLTPGPLHLVARSPGYLDVDRELTLSAGKNPRCTIVLEPLSQLEGRVVDSFGAAVAYVTVEARAVSTESDSVAVRDICDAEGRFEIAVPGGSEHSFFLREHDQWLAIDASRFGTFVAPRAGIVLKLRLEDQASAFVVGRVVDAGGPLEGARFQISDGEAIGTVGNNTPGTRLSDEFGRFRIGPLPAREFVLVVHPKDPALPSFRSAKFALTPNEVHELGDLPVPEYATLLARTLFEDGKPCTRALLQLESQEKDGRSEIVEFGAEGRLERGLSPGTYEATIYGNGFLTVHRRLELSAGEVENLELTPIRAYRCPIDVTLPEGEVEGQLVIRAAEGSEEFRTELGPDDPVHVLWPALTPGEHMAVLTCGNARRYVAHFDAKPADGSDQAVILTWRRVE